jgi:hypothetical protein
MTDWTPQYRGFESEEMRDRVERLVRRAACSALAHARVPVRAVEITITWEGLEEGMTNQAKADVVVQLGTHPHAWGDVWPPEDEAGFVKDLAAFLAGKWGGRPTSEVLKCPVCGEPLKDARVTFTKGTTPFDITAYEHANGSPECKAGGASCPHCGGGLVRSEDGKLLVCCKNVAHSFRARS